ncbi:nitroreductase/quinone reductase family protein [Microbacterium sp. BG28]|uniref:nitroreductase/quinone reductase family protein n=1 Tax=Microbacterium sp. BG28 TaxID=3097356 RepID=UPI002A5B04B2|nr:nitroreductase/quinone reductase family protein [Microbacterium sp. BG28]MDY0828064.1 nitroreductase/quinone reductase family protein [Microbacterium sp. BG28]
MTSYNDHVIAEFRRNGGRVENFGDALILLHHIGARSATERISPLMALPDGADAWLIAASKAGAEDNPAWFHNLRAYPDVTIETPSGEVPVTARVLEPTERDAAWQRFLEASPGFGDYERRTTRTIPVIRLERR